MNPEFRPIPISILDFLCALLPGLVWLLLLVATADLALTGSTSVSRTWEAASTFLKNAGVWAGPLVAIGGALVIGYCLKPLAMGGAQLLSRYLFKLSPRTWKSPAREMIFPFPSFFDCQSYLEKVQKILLEEMGLSVDDQVPGRFPFSSAKRYLRLAAPSLWEESERMEAEVRMMGALFLAAIYNLLLTVVVLVVIAKQGGAIWSAGVGCWITGSTVAPLAVGMGFNHSRLREVESTYMNLLLAAGHRRRSGGSPEGNEEEGGG